MKRLITTGLLLTSTVFAAGCGESPEDQARDAGQDIGESLRVIYTADSAEAVGKELDKIDAAAEQARAELPEEFREQLAPIREEFAEEARAATDPAALRAAYLNAVAQFNTLKSDTNSVVNEFRRGVAEGLADN